MSIYSNYDNKEGSAAHQQAQQALDSLKAMNDGGNLQGNLYNTSAQSRDDFDNNNEPNVPIDEEEQDDIMAFRDDISSLNDTAANGDSHESSHLHGNSPRQNNDQQSQGILSNESMDVLHVQKMQRNRNILIIVMLLTFLGVVTAIGAGVGVAVKNNKKNDAGTSEANGGDNAEVAVIDEDDSDGDVEDGENAGADPEEVPIVVSTVSPTTSPSAAPCVPLELSIIFDEYAGETSWKVVQGVYSPDKSIELNSSNTTADKSDNNDTATMDTDEVEVDGDGIVWKSKYYAPNSFNSRADSFQECLPPGTYTLVFMDREGDGICCYHGEGLYALSSEGNIVTIGGEMTSKEEAFTFDLPFVEPDPVDENGDGLDDRTKWVMPLDSSNFVEGDDCENFHLMLKTDNYGFETKWELYEGSDKSGRLMANGGPYASDSIYEVDYCLPSSQDYVLFFYDWAREGICCSSGNGSYNITSGSNLIFSSDGDFEQEEITMFSLPLLMTEVPSSMPTSTPPTKAPVTGITSPTMPPVASATLTGDTANLGASESEESCFTNAICSSAGSSCTSGIQTCCGTGQPVLECTCSSQGFFACLKNDSCGDSPKCCPDVSNLVCATNTSSVDECDVVGEECSAADDKGKMKAGWCCKDECSRKYCAV